MSVDFRGREDGEVPNRLADATSPYLLQHAENPVDWWPWGPAAFAEAERTDKPILLSIGYAACHWCHVMAHESFEDAATARLMNERFVSIKVDREERPDVDAVYMAATQALTGQGGWPMTVFLTPGGQPFYAGTYFPPRPAHGMPSFVQVVTAVSEAWTGQRDEVLSSVANIQQELASHQPDLPGHHVTDADLDQAVERLRADYDAEQGGFGRAPKFPPSMVLEGLLRLGETQMSGHTLEAMARGGIYDQLAGGFARYSVDAGWVVPHFEKMLYDNALLLGVYTHWWRRTRHPLAARVVEETADWLDREMLTEGGAYAASLDADSVDERDGQLREGAFYVWTPAEIGAAVIGLADQDTAAAIFGVTVEGTFEHGRSVLQLPSDPDEHRWADVRAALRRNRDRRPRPARDDKIVAAWNGWLIDSLVQAAGVFDRADWLQRAEAAAEYLWRVHWVDGRLRRTSRDGEVGEAPAILEDHAALVLAATRLGAARAEPLWLERAVELAQTMITAFDDGRGGFFDTAADAEQLYLRPREVTDNATPSGTSTAVHALQLLAEATGRTDFAERADQAAAAVGALVPAAPRFAGWLLADGATRLRRPAVQVAIVGPADDPATATLTLVAHRLAPAGSVIIAGEPADDLALLADRTMIDGRPTAYVCRRFVCRLPVTEVEGLTAQLVEAAG